MVVLAGSGAEAVAAPAQALFLDPAQIVTGAGTGGGAHVRAFDGNGTPRSTGFFAEPGTSGQRVAVGDVDGDGKDEIVTASGPGVRGAVRVFSITILGGAVLEATLFPYGPFWMGGVSVAVGDVDGDGMGDIITGAGPGGGPHVRALRPDGTGLASFFAYAANFRGGVEVAAGDLDDDGRADIITGAGPGGGPHVRAVTVDGQVLASFFAYAPGFTGGVFVGSGDFDDDAVDDIVTGAGAGGGPHVRTFDGFGTPRTSFFPYSFTFGGGVRVAAADVNGDGVAEVITGAGPGGGPVVRVLTAGGVPQAEFLAYAPRFPGGVYVAGGYLTQPIVNDSRGYARSHQSR